MTSDHPLRQIVGELDRAGIEYMLVGSFASTSHGDPRTTNDIDFVIDCDRASLERFVRQLDPDLFYVSPEAADEAWRRRAQFNVVILGSGWKIDLILRKSRPFSRERGGSVSSSWSIYGSGRGHVRASSRRGIQSILAHYPREARTDHVLHSSRRHQAVASPQHFLNFRPLPQGHGALRPIFG